MATYGNNRAPRPPRMKITPRPIRATPALFDLVERTDEGDFWIELTPRAGRTVLSGGKPFALRLDPMNARRMAQAILNPPTEE